MAVFRSKSRKRAMARKKRYNKKLARRRRNKASVTRLPTGSLVAERTFTKLRYTQRIDLTPAAAATESYVFSGNSAFDPDVTGAGAQPLGFDQYATLYNKYRVRGSKMKVTAAVTSGSHFPCKITIYPQDDNASATGVDNAAARPNSKTRVTAGYGSPNVTLSKYMSSKKQLGVKSINEETSFAALVNANPSIRWYWCVSVGTIDATTNIAGLYAEVEITYYVEFYDVVDLILS